MPKLPETHDETQPPSIEKVRRRSVTIFAVISALVISVATLVIGTQLAKEIRYNMINSYALSTGSQASGAVNAFLSPDDLKQPFKGQLYDDFKKHVEKVTAGTSVEQVKLWSPDGVVLFSLDKESVGKQFDNHELEEAAEGEPVVEISELEEEEHASEREEHDQLLEMYYPVSLGVPGPGAKADAVYEVYVSLAPLESHINSTMRTLAISMAILTLFLIILAEYASGMLKKRNDKLTELSSMLELKADTDGLTGLYNHRHFQSFLDSQIKRAERYKHELSLIIIDLDFFKAINDRFGHQTGDKVLKRVADVFSSILRDVDYAARYGGEEFVVVLPETGLQGAVDVAERLREATDSMEITIEGTSDRPKVSISCGVADYPACCSDRESLVATADSALLFAKRQGRNRVCTFRDISGADLENGDLEKLVSRLQHSNLPTIQALVAAVESTDAYDSNRVRNMGALASDFGIKLDLPEDLRQALKIAAQIHDIGKTQVPEHILGKTEELTEAEIEAIRTHPQAGAQIVETASQMENLLSAILHHHENWDGSGYPDGLKEDAIPLLARVIRIMDAYEAMISDRPYRPALSIKEAVNELRSQAGAEFDPSLTATFISCLKLREKS